MSRDAGIVERVRAVVWGESDRRVRATWRVLLPWPLLWFAAGTLGVAAAGAVVPTGVSRPANIMVFGLFQALFSGVAWVAWSRSLDRRPLSDYGLALSRSWLRDLLAGFGAVLVGYGVWYALGASLGWADVVVSTATLRTSIVFGLGAVFVGILVNVWVQQTVFFGVTLQNAAEGLSSRGVSAARAVGGALVVAVLIFTVKHRPATAGRVLNLVVALGTFGLLYVHTESLALPIGVHTGVNYAGNALFVAPSLAADSPAVFEVSTSLSGLPGGLSAGAIPQLLFAYLAILAWLGWRRGTVGLETGLARSPEP